MRVRPWLRLFRVPNLVTVPGDPLAGIVLAAGGCWPGTPAAWMVVLAALAFYAAGLAMNDLADLREDARDRPGRPLPSGQIPVGSAVAAAVSLSLSGLVLSLAAGPRSLLAGTMLLSCILLYNFLAKRMSVFGPFVMGLCRGLSVLLGASPFLHRGVSDPLLLLAAFEAALLFVAMVSHLARFETTAVPPRYAAWTPFAVFVLFSAFAVFRVRPGAPSLLAFAAAVLVGALMCGLAARAMQLRRRVRPSDIGLLISALLPLQAVWMAVIGRWDFAAAILLLLPLQQALKRVAASS